MKEYIVLRIANNPDGSVSVPANAYDNEKAADDQYCTLRKQANASNNPSDTVIKMSNTGIIYESKTYTHTVEQEGE